MESRLKVSPISSDEFAATRPGWGTIAVGIAIALSLVSLYYWPLIRELFGL